MYSIVNIYCVRPELHDWPTKTHIYNDDEVVWGCRSEKGVAQHVILYLNCVYIN